MRKRNRGNWPLIAHQYWIRPEFREWFDMPVPLQAEAGQMWDLWNQLTSTFDQNGQEYEAILSQNLKVQELKEKTNNLKEEFEKAKRALKSAKQRLRRQTHPELTSFQEAKKQAKEKLNKAREELKEAKKNAREEVLPSIKELWDKFRTQTEGLFEKCSTSYSNKEFIFNCFGAAVRKFLTGKGKRPKRKSGLPREVHFHHRFGNTGLPVERIFGRGQRLHLQPIPKEALDPTLKQRKRKRLARTTGTFQVGDVAIPFQTILHRPLPQEAYLKSAALVGRMVIGRGYHYHQEGDSGHSIPARWDWSLLLTFEVPPREVPERQESEPVAGLDLNYRMWEDSSLRVGVLLDSTGHKEYLFLPEKTMRAWRYKRQLQTKADKLLEETKKKLRVVERPEKLPQGAQGILDRLDKVRARGLKWLLFQLEETGVIGNMTNILRQWADQSTRIIREMRGVEQRYIKDRDYFYRNEALRICKRYRQLAVEALNLKKMGSKEEIEENPRLKEAAKHRQLAALSHLLSSLQQAAAKTGTSIERFDPAYTTLDCYWCGARVPENSGELILTCPNGHQWDQDENAARNLLARLQPTSRSERAA